MKFINILSLLITISLFMCFCKKNKIENNPTASLNIVNVVTGGQTIKMGSNATLVSNNTHYRFGWVPGNLDIYIFPINDSLTPYYSSDKGAQISNGDMYTLFLGGQLPQVESMLLKETFTNYEDSVFGIRFINLSPNSPNVNVTLSTSDTVNEFLNIGYKQISEFKKFSALASNTSYTLQVRDAGTKLVITSITLNGPSLTTGIPRFKNITLVLRGLVNGNPGAGITRVNHY